MYENTAEAGLRCSSISLEDGADEAWLDGEPISLCEAGACFPSRWRFDAGTTLSLTLEICGTQERARAEGVVAMCEPIGERLWAVTVVFLETPAGSGFLGNTKKSTPEALARTPVIRSP